MMPPVWAVSFLSAKRLSHLRQYVSSTMRNASEFAQRLIVVATHNRLDRVGYLFLYVTLAGIHLAERNLGNSLPTFSRVQVVFLLQFACSPLALVEVIAGTDGLSVLLYTDGLHGW